MWWSGARTRYPDRAGQLVHAHQQAHSVTIATSLNVEGTTARWSPSLSLDSAHVTTLDKTAIEALIPHRDPFLLIDRVTEFEPGARAVAEHTFTGNEWYQAGHFPGNPIVPGVILVESMAQTATVMAMALPEYRDGLGLFAGIEEMRFKRMVKPGETARFEATVDKMRRGFARVKVRTFVGDELAAEGVIIAVFQRKAKA